MAALQPGVNQSRLSLCIDDDVIRQWYCQSHHGRRVHGFQFIDNRLLNEPLKFPCNSCISKRTKTVLVRNQLPSQRPIAHLVIDCTGMKVLGKCEWKWKTRKHAKEKCSN